MSNASQPIRRIKGTHDITPDVAPLWRYVEAIAADLFELYNFHEIRTPIFERTEVFQRSIGETSDIVEKQMYTFSDRGGESLTLRPEGTAAVVRSYIEQKFYAEPGVCKFYYAGPMFRAERPQAGRFRQFHQIGAEVFGAADPGMDAELIIMLMDLFTELGVTDLKIKLNSLGCTLCRPEYRKALHTFLKQHEDRLCENCRNRIDRNPLRALDCKAAGCTELAAEAPPIDDHRCNECRDHLDRVRRPLLDLELPVILDPGLVRGLDYYNRTAFEVVAENGSLGSQNSVAGGGRYDTLVEQFGGPPTPAIGFAIGLERLISLVDKTVMGEAISPPPDIYMILLTPPARERTFEIAHRLRSFGYRVERGFEGGSVKSQMRKANRSKAKFALIVGEDELAQNSATLRDMENGEQRLIAFNNLLDALDELLGDQPPPETP